MEGLASWKSFETTGSVEAYLRYKGEAGAEKARQREAEVSLWEQPTGRQEAGEESIWERPLR